MLCPWAAWSMGCAGVRSGSSPRCSSSAPWMFDPLLEGFGRVRDSTAHSLGLAPLSSSCPRTEICRIKHIVQRPICCSSPTTDNNWFPLLSGPQSIKSQRAVGGWTTRYPASAFLWLTLEIISPEYQPQFPHLLFDRPLASPWRPFPPELCYSTSRPSRLHAHFPSLKTSTRVIVCTSTATAMKGLTQTPPFTKVCAMPSTFPTTFECTSARLTDTNTVVLVHLTGISSVPHHTCPLYVFDLPCYCVIPMVAQTNISSVPVVHATPSPSAPAPTPVAANNGRSSTLTQKDEDLTQLEQDIISSPWHAANALEPTCGSLNCPYRADLYGIRGLSCYTAFVDTKPDGTFGCWYEECSRYSVRRLEDAVKHLRANHFNHKPFLCVPTNGTPW